MIEFLNYQIGGDGLRVIHYFMITGLILILILNKGKSNG